MTGQYPRPSDTFIQREIQALRRRGVIVETISIRTTPAHELVSPEQRVERNRTFHVLPCSPVRMLRAHGWVLTRRPIGWLRALRLAWQTAAPGVRGLAYQLFYLLEAAIVAHHLHQRNLPHLHNHFADSSCTVAMLAATMGGSGFSFTLHGPGIFYEVNRWRVDRKLQEANFVCCISRFCHSQAMMLAPPACWRKLHVVHCGVDLGATALAEQRDAVREHGRATARLLFIGRLAAAKGLPVLLDAMKTLPGAELTLIGDGPDRHWLEQRAMQLELNGRVRFLGWQSQAAIGREFKTSDVFVLPSFAEGVPVVLMEAMAAGVPVVATRIAGVPELIEHERTGLLVTPGDAAGLAQAITRLLDQPARARQLATAARQTIELDFNIDTEAGKLLALLGRTLGANSTASADQPIVAPAGGCTS